MESLDVRRYRASDHDEVWTLHNLALEAVGAHAGHGPFDDDLHHIDQVYLNAGGEFLVGVLAGRIVAMGALKRLSDERAEVTRMRVHPDCWRRGFGRTLLEHLERRAVELGYRTISLETTVGQLAAQKLYRNAGYVETGRTKHFGFNVIEFEKVLPPPEAGR